MSGAFLAVEPSKIIFLVYNTIPQRKIESDSIMGTIVSPNEILVMLFSFPSFPTKNTPQQWPATISGRGLRGMKKSVHSPSTHLLESVYLSYIGIMEKNMETTARGLYRDYIGVILDNGKWKLLFRGKGLGGLRDLGFSIPIGFRVEGSRCMEIREGVASRCLG